MRNPTPAPIVIPVTGTPTCRGIYLGTNDLSEWRNDDRDAGLDADMVIKARADRATRDGACLCLRPTADGKGACVGMTPTAFAVASLADDFAARALVVDPYDRDGNDIREASRFQVGQRVRLTANSQNPVTGVIHLAKGTIGTVTRQAWKDNEDPNSEVVVQWEGANRPLRTFMGVVEAAPLTAEEAHDVAVWEGSERV